MASVPSGYVPGFLSCLVSSVENPPSLFAYYDSSNNPNFANTQTNTGIAAGSTGGDSISTIHGANYMSDGQKRGLKLGDFVLVLTDQATVGTDVGYLMFVSAVQAVSAGYGVTLTLISTS